MNEVKIVNTVKEDVLTLFHLFNQATALQGKSGYKVWDQVDKETLEKDLESHLQYKILKGPEIACVFRIQYSDPLIWRDKDQGNAVYLHRVVIDQKFRGQKLFTHVTQSCQDKLRE